MHLGNYFFPPPHLLDYLQRQDTQSYFCLHGTKTNRVYTILFTAMFSLYVCVHVRVPNECVGARGRCLQERD